MLNRANSKVKLDVSEVERTLQIKAESLIPSDVVVPQSVNKGTPVVLDSPRSPASPSRIEQLADLFMRRRRRPSTALSGRVNVRDTRRDARKGMAG